MRTTWDIDLDVLTAIKERARREGKTSGNLATILLRGALTGENGRIKNGVDEEIFEYKNGLPVLRSRGEIITAEHVRSLMEEEDLLP